MYPVGLHPNIIPSRKEQIHMHPDSKFCGFCNKWFQNEHNFINHKWCEGPIRFQVKQALAAEVKPNLHAFMLESPAGGGSAPVTPQVSP